MRFTSASISAVCEFVVSAGDFWNGDVFSVTDTRQGECARLKSQTFPIFCKQNIVNFYCFKFNLPKLLPATFTEPPP